MKKIFFYLVYCYFVVYIILGPLQKQGHLMWVEKFSFNINDYVQTGYIQNTHSKWRVQTRAYLRRYHSLEKMHLVIQTILLQ